MLNGAELVKPGEERWDSARAAWNLAIDQRPAMVARPGNADEVAAVVKLRSRERLACRRAGRGTRRGPAGRARRGHAPAQDGAHDGGRDRRRESPRTGRCRPPSGTTSARWPRRRGSPVCRAPRPRSGSWATCWVADTAGSRASTAWPATAWSRPRSSPRTDSSCAPTARTSPTSSGRCAAAAGTSAW